MRLHRLEMTAFGPFAETTSVDFDALSSDGLFLLHGHTGAGKTTVLDAIAFALYGTVPGARQECKRLHSDHAPAATPPKVVLEATVGGRRLRIVRSPEFSRPKLRGDGVRTENAKATLTWLDGRGQNLTRIVEIGDEVNRLLGMSADQFFQVVLLPQGEFARFLCAANEDRERLLERLFDTARFGTAEQWLANRRRESSAQLDSRTQAIDRLVAQVCTAADADGPADDPIEWAQDLLENARDAKLDADAHLEQLHAAADEAVRRLDDARHVAELQRRIRAAQCQLEEYRSGADRRAVLSNELAQSRRAAGVGALVEDHAAAKRQARQSDAAMIRARDHLTHCNGGVVVERADLESAVRAWTEELGRLDLVVADVKTVASLESTVQRLVAEQKAATAQSQQLAAEHDAIPAEIDAAERELVRCTDEASEIPVLTDRKDRAADAVAAAAELLTLRAALGKANAQFESSRARHNDAKERVLELRELRLSGMAAELAGALRDGSACQVCGSVEHPAPALPAATTVTESDELAAADAEVAAAAQRDRAVAAVHAVERAMAGLTGRGGDRESDVLASELAAATRLLAAAQSARRRANALTTAIADLRHRAERVGTALRDIEIALSAGEERIAAARVRIDELRDGIVAAIGSDECVEDRRDRLEALATAGARLRDAYGTASTAAALATATERKLERLSRESGFDSVEAATAAVRTAAEQRRLEAELTTANERRAHAEAVLAEPEIAAVAGAEPPDVEALEAAHSHIRATLDHAIAEQAQCTRRATKLAELVAQLWAAHDHLAPMQAAHDELEKVADLVAGRGQNSRRMSLRSYVLAARLEEVAVAASARLRRMSGGRFEFVHTDARGPRGKRGGLGLEIRDDYTGSVRPAKTLSGGETFTASLALALGLADVVAAESGGLVLDTMFIDEGFGSLDDDALDSVMGVLDELRAGGRVVGIVSHVDELRQRIPNRLHVIRGRAGSRLEVRVAG
ncbi:AAA family ATPase [Antrihabitans stalactiti]|uniref:Nuclease SbcCD subunit C n=1 Tax=Antrihabitans stalactiti TaxID=2584121 RepID=A0A848KH30_9NOCA|nr:SMC family ATPase [Antrihabitans stalactiti]